MSKNQNQKTNISTLSTEFATPSLAEFQSALSYLPNPDEVLKSQGGSTKVYRQMRDGHLTSVRQKRFAAVTARPWTIDGSKSDPKKAKIIEEHLWNLEIRDTITQMMSALDYGHAEHEVVWDVVDTDSGKLILPIKIIDRKQEWFKFTDTGELRFQTKSNQFLEPPPRKFIITRNKPSSSQPYGEALRGDCFWPLAFKKGGLKFWMIYVEKFGIPKAVGKGPSSMTETEQKKFLKSLYSLVRDAVAVIPQNGSIELLESKLSGGSLLPQEAIVKWADAEISKVWLGETLTTEQTSTGGTQAMATVHNDVRSDLALDDVAMIEKSFNTLIRWIWQVNWPNEKVIPWMNIILPKDLQIARVDRDVKLSQSLGVRFKKEYVTDVYGIDGKYFEIVEPITQQAPAFAEKHQCSCFAEKSIDKKDLEKNVEEILSSVSDEDLQDQIEELAKPIIELAEKCGNYVEFEKALNDALPNLEGKKLEQSVEKCLLLAEMAGRFDA